VWQGSGAVSMGAVADAVGPFAGHRLVEALDLSVWLRPPFRGAEVTNLLVGEQLAQ
jgi:hypothetical protein